MRRLAAFLVLFGLFACAPAARAGVVSWHASSGVLPSDPSIPPGERYLLTGEPSFASMTGGLMNLNDTSDPLHVVFGKINIDPAQFEGDWVYQGELRINSHNGPGFNWGTALGFFDGQKRTHLLVADNAVGFSGPYANSFLNDLFFAMDTTDDVHAYRAVKTAGVISLFVDTFTAPVLAIPYDEFIDDDRNQVWLAGTSEFGVADLDVRSFAYNLDGTLVPEPSTALLLAAAGWLALHRRRAAWLGARVVVYSRIVMGRERSGL